MKKLLRTLLLLTSVFVSSPSQAGHAMGGTVAYKYLGNSQYRIIVKYYRDCRSIAFNPSSINIGWFAGKNGLDGCGSGKLSGFVRTGIKDISVVCSWLKKPCNPQNSPAGEGMEEHVFEDTIDISQAPFASALASSSCPDLTIWMESCCRNGAITTGPGGQDFYATCIISVGNLRKCPSKGNNSVEFRMPPIGFLCCATGVYTNPGVTDTADRDSISYHLVPALQNIPNQSVTYSKPYSYSIPLYVHCIPTSTITCSPSPGSDPPRGMFLDPKSGDIIFTPTKCDEVTPLVVEVREYRKDSSGNYLMVGASRRDMQLIIKDDCGYNKPPVISGNFILKVKAGEKVCTNFTIEDKKFTPYQSIPDTLKTSWNGENANAVFTPQSDTIPNKEVVEFCWQTKTTDASTNSWHFNINASDNHCDKPVLSSRGILVYVLPEDSSWMTASTSICNQLVLKGETKSQKAATYNWKILDSATGKLIFSNTNSGSVTSIALEKGVYKIVMQASNDYFMYDEVVQFYTIAQRKTKVEAGAYRAACIGTNPTILAKDSFAKAPLQFEWVVNTKIDSATTTNSYTISNIQALTALKVTLTDANGCMATDTLSIGVMDLPKVAWSQNPLDDICHSAADVHLNDFIQFPDPATLGTGKLQMAGSLTQFGPKGLVDSGKNQQFFLLPSKINAGSQSFWKETITMWFTDTNGCVNQASTVQTIHENPEVVLNNKTFCQNLGGTYLLDSAIVKPKTKPGFGRIWDLLDYPSGVDPNKAITVNGKGEYVFHLGTPGDDSRAGNYRLVLTVTDPVTGCTGMDTMMLELIATTKVEKVTMNGTCQPNAKLDLTKYFLVFGFPPNPANCKFRIKAFNGSTDSNLWKNTKLVDGRYFPANAGFGTWTVECISNETGCAGSAENNLIIYAKPNAAFTTNPTDTADINSPYFTVQNTSDIASGDNLNFSWNFNYPHLGNTSTAFEPGITYPFVKAQYLVRMVATSDKGCKDTADKKLAVGFNLGDAGDLAIAGAKMNQYFQVLDLELQQMELRIFDASGKLLHQSSGNTKVVMPKGVYFYHAQLQLLNGQTVHLRGKMPVTAE